MTTLQEKVNAQGTSQFFINIPKKIMLSTEWKKGEGLFLFINNEQKN